MHPSLLPLVVAFGAFSEAPAAVEPAVVFAPVHDAYLPVRGQGGGDIYYSRNGTFRLDGEGRFVNASGMALVTIKAGPTPAEASWEEVRLPAADLQTPRASRTVKWHGNLDPYAARLRFSPSRPALTSNLASEAVVYDAGGNAHRIAVYFNANGTSGDRVLYRWVAMVDPTQLQDPNARALEEGTAGNADNANTIDANTVPWAPDSFGRIGGGALVFNRSGTLAAVTGNSVTVRFVGMSETQTLALDFGKPADLRHNGRSGLTAFENAAARARLTQDGYTSRGLFGISALSGDGTLVATLSDGQSIAVGPLVMARFYDTHGMGEMGDEVFAAGNDSGTPYFDVPTCADVTTRIATDAPRTADVCPFAPQPWQRINAADGTYFVLEGAHAGWTGTYLARDIDLRLIAGAPLQEAREGLRLGAVVTAPDGTVSSTGDAGGLIVPPPTDLLAPKATTQIVLVGNLDASNPPRNLDPYHLQASANLSREVAVFDDTGAPHRLRFDFYAQSKAAINDIVHHRYLWLATFDPADHSATDGGRELDDSVADGILVFDPNGTLYGKPLANLELPLGPGGAPVAQTVYFGEPPQTPVTDADAANPNDAKADDANANANDANASDANANDANAPVPPAPLTCLPRAGGLGQSYQDGWRPDLADLRYGLDVCGILSVHLPTGEWLALGTITVVRPTPGDAPQPLNDWLFAWPAQGAESRAAACDDIVFSEAAAKALNTKSPRPLTSPRG